jgi:hypothetical protein
MKARRRCSVAEADRTNVACASIAGAEAGISNINGANREDNAWGVRPERWE